jgi:hypothetical protein
MPDTVLPTRGGDFDLHIGQDVSIGYSSHTDTAVRLYLQETFTFLLLTTEAAVALAPPTKAPTGVVTSLKEEHENSASRHIKHFALGIHGAPKIDHAAGDFQIDLIQIPGSVGLGSTFAQIRPDHGPEMIHPAPNSLVGDHDPAFRQQVFDVTYTYASATDKDNGVWWNRQLLGLYFPVVSLSRPQL